MKAHLNTSIINIETFEIVSRFGGTPYVPPAATAYGYGKGVNKPVSVSAGGFLFFTDTSGLLWKYDYITESVYPVGLANESNFINHQFTPKRVVDYPIAATATLTAFTEVDGAPFITLESLNIIHDNLLGNYTPDGRLKNAIIWICGFPFYGKSVVEDPEGTFTVELATFESSYFYFPYENYTDWWESGPLHTGKLPMAVVISQDISTKSCDFFFDNRLISTSAAEEDNVVSGYTDGNLEGEYEYVFCLVTRHGYESNWCGPFTVKLEKNQCRILISWEDWVYPSTYLGYYLNFSTEYIRSIRVYRSYRDAPGAWYFHSEIPFAPRSNWQVVLPIEWIYRSLMIDNKGDESLGDAIHPWKLTPTTADSLAATKNTLAVGVSTGVYISAVGDPETFYQYIPFPSGVVAVDAIPYFDDILVFCKNEIFAINIFDFSIKPLSVGVGLIGKNAKAVLNDRIIFMAPGGGIYQYTGGKPALIPGFEKIRDVLTGKSLKRKINRQTLESTFFIHQPKENKIWCILGENGKFGNMALAISLDSPRFEIFTFPWNLVSGICFENAGDYIVMLSDEDGNVYSFNSWARGDNGMSVPFMMETGQFGSLTHSLRFRRLLAEIISKADLQMVVSGSYDREGYRSEGVMNFLASARGDERWVNTYNLVVPTYQFKMECETREGFQLSRFSIIYQPKQGRSRPWR